MSLKWSNRAAAKLYIDMRKLFGNPVAVIPNKEGLALWTKDKMKKKVFGIKNIFQEHLLRDEMVPHNCPKKHYDFFYSYIKVDIKPEKLPEVLSLSGSVGYDPLKKLLYARCASLAANIATLKVVSDILLNKKVEIELDGEKYKYQGIGEIQKYGVYGKTIGATKDNPVFIKKLYTNLSNNLKKYNKSHKPKETGYWKAAFSYKNGECYPPDKANKICKNKKGGSRNKPNKPIKLYQHNKPNKGGDKRNKPNKLYNKRGGYNLEDFFGL